MDEGRAKAIREGAAISAGGSNFNYVNVSVLERLGIAQYRTKKPGGNNFIRMVAPSATGAFAREVWIHSNVGSNNSVFVCMERTFGEPCAVCDHIKELKAKNSTDTAAKDLAPTRRFLVFVVDTTSGDTEDEGTKWFDCPQSIYKEVCNLSKDKRTGASIDPTDPVNGRDIEFVRVDGTRTSYSGFKLEKTKPIPESWYTGLPPFDEILLRPPYEEVKQAVVGKKAEKKEVDSTQSGRSERRETETVRSEPPVEVEVRRSRRDREEPTVESTEDANKVQDKLAEIKNRRSNRE